MNLVTDTPTPEEPNRTPERSKPSLQIVMRADRETLFDALEKDGAVIVADMLSPELVERLNQDLDAVIEQTPEGGQGTSKSERTFYGQLGNLKSDVLAES